MSMSFSPSSVADGSGFIASQWKRPIIQRWWPMLPIMLLSIVMRLSYLQTVGFDADFRTYGDFMSTLYYHHPLEFYDFYVNDRVYPPLTTTSIALVAHLYSYIRLASNQSSNTTTAPLPAPTFDIIADSTLMALTKAIPLLAELAIIAAAYSWLRDRSWLRWVVPIVLALAPGLIANTMWWGQYDALVTLFIVLALVALNSGRPLLAWAMLALALLTKQQAVLLPPLLLILTLRRYGLRKLVACLTLCAAIGILGVSPFVVGSGLPALRPYTQAGDPLSNISNSALNLWYAIPAVLHATVSTDLGQLGHIDDSISVVAGANYREIGWGLLGLYMLLVLIVAWKQADRPREFIWASAIFFGAFLFPTQIHERYLYIPLVLMAFAVAQDRRLLWIAVGISYTFAYNMFQVASLVPWFGRGALWPGDLNFPVALLNLSMFAVMQHIVLMQLNCVHHAWENLVRLTVRLLAILSRVVLVLAVLSILIVGGAESWTNIDTAVWLSAHVADFEHLGVFRSDQEVSSDAIDFGHGASWKWDIQSDDAATLPDNWLPDGVHYAVIDSLKHPSAQFDIYLQSMVDQGATLLYRSDLPTVLNGLVPQQAVLWTFRPQHELNVVMDGSLMLIGYNVVKDRPGNVGLLFHWYTQKTTPIAYNLFLHLIDPKTGQLLSQGDSALGSDVHPSSLWRQNEILFETYYLPITALPAGTTNCHIQFGLYQLSSGARAMIKDSQGQNLGDTISQDIPCS